MPKALSLAAEGDVMEFSPVRARVEQLGEGDAAGADGDSQSNISDIQPIEVCELGSSFWKICNP